MGARQIFNPILYSFGTTILSLSFQDNFHMDRYICHKVNRKSYQNKYWVVKLKTIKKSLAFYTELHLFIIRNNWLGCKILRFIKELISSTRSILRWSSDCGSRLMSGSSSKASSFSNLFCAAYRVKRVIDN